LRRNGLPGPRNADVAIAKVFGDYPLDAGIPSGLLPLQSA
jgi:hypothetical protein